MTFTLPVDQSGLDAADTGRQLSVDLVDGHLRCDLLISHDLVVVNVQGDPSDDITP